MWRPATVINQAIDSGRVTLGLRVTNLSGPDDGVVTIEMMPLIHGHRAGTAYNPTTGVLSLTGSDTLAAYRQVLRTVAYNNTGALGGTAHAIGTAEVRFPSLVPESYGVGLSLFTDFGTLGRVDNLFGQTRLCTGAQYSGIGTCVKDNLAFRGSAGISVTWKSPFGPVKIDLGLPYMKTYYDRPQIIHFSTATGY